MNKTQLLRIARRVLMEPTAPLHEDAIKDVVQRFCRARPDLSFSQCPWGNLVVRYKRGAARQPVVFEAHMDHPGFEILKNTGRGSATAQLLGGVNVDALAGTKVRIFCHSSGKSPVTARRPGGVRGVVTAIDRRHWARTKQFSVEVDGPVERGDFGMWDLKPFALSGDRLYTRACDDLVGCIAILGMLDELVRRKINANVIAVFTRAEELGFFGTLAFAHERTIPPSSIVISVEMSKEIPAGRMGQGPIVRVGDRATIFNSDVTFYLREVALRLKAKNPAFVFQRALMDGGTCTATVFHQLGYRTGAVCLALGNYHNHAPNGKIREEFVSVSDLQNMVELFVAAAREADNFEEIVDSLNQSLELRYIEAKRRLQPTLKIPAASRKPTKTSATTSVSSSNDGLPPRQELS